MSKKYPNVIFVKREKENDGSTYLLAHEHAAEVAEINAEIEVAQYRLDQVVVVKSGCEVVGKGKF